MEATGYREGERTNCRRNSIDLSDGVLLINTSHHTPAHGPTISSKTWYGMPAYAKDGKVVCFFQSARVL
jgi:hypothetical protein